MSLFMVVSPEPMGTRVLVTDREEGGSACGGPRRSRCGGLAGPPCSTSKGGS